ncbi:hypothetical protein BDV93DRAFT_566150 [Ceratobasidium sp. AG-I]|nr:hypothetical protein BDV93DRAFT_566150 [Ceratobasidium sp. AG-I]
MDGHVCSPVIVGESRSLRPCCDDDVRSPASCTPQSQALQPTSLPQPFLSLLSPLVAYSSCMSPKSAHTVSIMMQVRTVMLRRVQILRGNIGAEVIMATSSFCPGFDYGSVFLKMDVAAGACFSRGGVLFFSILFGALSAVAEIPALYAQRPIVARHQKAAMYHPFAEALAVTAVDIPITLIAQILFAIVLYWMTGLQKAAFKFFIFLLFTLVIALMMKAFFRALAASFGREPSAQAVSGIDILALVLYTGYTIPTPSMIGALKWIIYISPMRYGFEALIVSKFHGLNGACSFFAPSGPGYKGFRLANQASFGYSYANLWRNFGIVVVFWVGFIGWYLIATERAGNAFVGVTQLIFKQNARIPSLEEREGKGNPESWYTTLQVVSTQKAQDALGMDFKSHPVFSWYHMNYDVTITKGEQRRLLNDVFGYVVPGKMTTLLNTLAECVGTSVITGDRFVNGQPLPRHFAAQTGYCQQMDIHLETTTVREALLFSAELHQPKSVPIEEKRAYVEEAIKICAMESYADAIVGIIGEGLNVEQRKRLTIGVELAAKPQLLLFLDEFLRSLADRGQAILHTIHQPSSPLFQAFDRLLLLRKGGQTCYFGNFRINSGTLISYFERNGARQCQPEENPAESMLDVIGAGATASSSIDWHTTWKSVAESTALEREFVDMYEHGRRQPTNADERHSEFAATYENQLSGLLVRSFPLYPTYIMSKLLLNVFAGLFIGFTFFKADNSIQGSQNKRFVISMATILSNSLSTQLQVQFFNFRNIYEYREKQSKIYSWAPSVISSLLVELPFNTIGSVFFFFCWYWTVGFENGRAGYMWLMLCICFPLYYTSFSQAVAAVAPDARIAGILFSFLFSFVITFNGVLQPHAQLIPFWKWISPVAVHPSTEI